MTYHIEVSLVPFSAIERSSSASGMQQILVRNVLADGRMCQQKSGMKQYVDIQWHAYICLDLMPG